MRESPSDPGETLIADFSSNTYAYKYRLSCGGGRILLRVDRTRPREGERVLVCELSLSRPEADALRAALDIYVACRGVPSEYKLREGHGKYPVLHPNGNVTLGEFLSSPSGRVYTCKSLATYSANPSESFGLFVDEPRCRECDGPGDRVADLALDLADATALRDGLVEFVARP